MTLMQRIKSALSRNVETNQIASVFGISESLVIKVKELMESQKSIEKQFQECRCPGHFHGNECP